MSLIWRKFREGKDGTKNSSTILSKPPYTSASHQQIGDEIGSSSNSVYQGGGAGPAATACVINPGIEMLFFPKLSPGVTDPLTESPQYVTTLRQVLDNPKARRLFLRYLDGRESRPLASFWVAVDSLRHSGLGGLDNSSASVVGSGRSNVDTDSGSFRSTINKNSASDIVLSTTNDKKLNAISKSDSFKHTRDALDDRLNDVRNNYNNTQCSNDLQNVINKLPDVVSNINSKGGVSSHLDMNLNRSGNSKYFRVDSKSPSSSNISCSCDTSGKLCDNCTVRMRLRDLSTDHNNANVSSNCDNETNSAKNNDYQTKPIDSSSMLNYSSNIINKNVIIRDSYTSNLNVNSESCVDIHSVKFPNLLDTGQDLDEEFADFCSAPLVESNVPENFNSCDQNYTNIVTINSHSVDPKFNDENSKFEITQHVTANKSSTESSVQDSDFRKDPSLNITSGSNDTGKATNQVPLNNVNTNNLQQHLVKEVWKIFDNFLAVDAACHCPLSHSTKLQLRNKISQIHVQCNTEIFTEAQDEAFILLESDLPGFLCSDQHLQHQLDLLSYTTITMPDVLQSPAAFPYYVEYLEQEGSRSLLEFWLAASNFRNQLKCSAVSELPPSQQQECGQNLSNQNQDDAMVLYDKYFSLQASHQLGFSDGLRGHIESNICQEKGPAYTCFDVALRVVLYVMKTKFLPGYLRSNLYDGYVNDLLASVRDTRRRRTGSGSTCSSDQGPVLGNTLLAGTRQGAMPEAASNIRIDATLIRDPDSLWRRKPFSRLSCGAITPLGRFESELLPEPTPTEGGRLGRTLRRLVNREEEEKARLDQAYSVASLVLHDVMRVTLDCRNCPSNPYHPDNPYDLSTLQGLQAVIAPPLTSDMLHKAAMQQRGLGALQQYRGTASQRYGSSSNLSTASSMSELNSSLHSPTKSIKSLTKTTSNYQLSDIADGLFGFTNHGLAHSYSLASFDLGTDVDLNFASRIGTDA